MRLLSRRWWLAVPLLALVYAAGTVPLPYYSLGPGPARAVEPLIRFEERDRFESSGTFVLTSVAFRQLTPLGMIRAWLDRDLDVVGRDVLYPDGQSEQQERQRSISQMDQSKIDAAYVVLEELVGYPERHGEGVLIEGVVPGCAAEGELFVGDVIEAIDGTAVSDVRDARRALEEIGPRERIRFDLDVDGEDETVTLVRGPCADGDEPLIGVSMIEAFPFEVTIASGGIGGPSAGLAWALGLYDLMTPGDLTSGATIAVTGALGADGTVYPIGGVEEKVAAAASAGAEVLVVPRDNLAEARTADTGDVRLIAVGSFDDAIDRLTAVA
ncbi:MAG TPA: S16 family serine protease [Actinomycetota bacterium]|nr:S16 family serine protease [Actinomycetota bacterium]